MNNDRKSKPFKMSFSKIFKDIKEKISKITSFKIKENKAANETEFIIRGENKMPEGIVKKTKTKKEPKLHPEIKQFMEEQKKFNNEVKEFMQDQNKKWKEQDKTNKEIRKFIKDQAEINKQIKETNQVILSSIQEILLRLQRIEKCPTIKKELDELE